jgi:hypothetical protein
VALPELLQARLLGTTSQDISLGALAVAAAVLWTRGSFGTTPTGETHTVNRSVPREGAQQTDLRLRLGAGVLLLQQMLPSKEHTSQAISVRQPH